MIRESLIFLLVLVAVAALTWGIRNAKGKRPPLANRPRRGDGYWTDELGYDHDWKIDPPKGRKVVFTNPYGKNPTGPKVPKDSTK